MVKLTAKHASEVDKILIATGLPRVYSKESEPVPYVDGMHILYITDAEGNSREIMECRGYHRRVLMSVTDGEYTLVNPLSPYAEGAFQSRQDVGNKFSSNPLLEGVYKREYMDGGGTK